MPQMPTEAVNGQHPICSDSKIHRINAWVRSVDRSYTPSEPGSCAGDELKHNVREIPTKHPYGIPAQVQSTTGLVSTQQCRRTGSRNKYNDNVRIPSKALSQHSGSHKGSFSGDVKKHAPVRNNVLKTPKQNTKTAAAVNSTVHTPFSPLSHHPTVLGSNSDKRDTGQKLPSAAAAYQAQLEEDMQLDSQVSLHNFENGNYEAQHETPQFPDNNEIAMEIDNYEELQEQIKLEVRTYHLKKRALWLAENSTR